MRIPTTIDKRDWGQWGEHWEGECTCRGPGGESWPLAWGGGHMFYEQVSSALALENYQTAFEYSQICSFIFHDRQIVDEWKYNDIIWKSSKVSHSAVLHDPPCPHAVYCGCPAVQWPGEADTCVGTHTASDWSISRNTDLWLARKYSSHSPSISLHEPCQVRTKLRTTVRRESGSLCGHLTKYIICHHFDYFLHLIDSFRNLYLCVFKSFKSYDIWC